MFFLCCFKVLKKSFYGCQALLALGLMNERPDRAAHFRDYHTEPVQQVPEGSRAAF